MDSELSYRRCIVSYRFQGGQMIFDVSLNLQVLNLNLYYVDLIGHILGKILNQISIFLILRYPNTN
jgi:hypothetical protein